MTLTGGPTLPKSRAYRVAGSATSTQLLGELPDFESPSMVATRRGDLGTPPTMLLIYPGFQQEGSESSYIRLELGSLEIGKQNPYGVLWQQQAEPDYSRLWRGVFSPLYQPKSLFSQNIEVRIADLPCWKPTIKIDNRALARGEDE